MKAVFWGTVVMSIKKLEYYEGAAIYKLARHGVIDGLRYEPPLFLLNNGTHVLIKHSAKKRSPWGFTFTALERNLLLERNCRGSRIILGLVCGSDGVAALTYGEFCSLVPETETSIRIACARSFGEHFLVKGANGRLRKKIAPSRWWKILKG